MHANVTLFEIFEKKKCISIFDNHDDCKTNNVFYHIYLSLSDKGIVMRQTNHNLFYIQ